MNAMFAGSKGEKKRGGDAIIAILKCAMSADRGLKSQKNNKI